MHAANITSIYMFRLSFGIRILLLIFLVPLFMLVNPGYGQALEYIPGKIVLKFEGNTSLWSAPGYQRSKEMVHAVSRSFGLVAIDPVILPTAHFAVSRRLDETQLQTTSDEILNELSRTYILTLSNKSETLELVRRLGAVPGVVYAEPFYTYTLTDIPDDPQIGQDGHNYFEYHHFFDAWSVSKSSEDVVIAILDTGVLYTHEDLQQSLWRNPDPGRASEVFPLIANDTIGWNFWQSGDIFNGEEPVQNNNPIGDFNDHGTFVAGLAAADTDNGIGMAGTGFRAQYMPVRIGGTQQYPRNVPFGPYGVLYAAINGADIINCSFGSPNFSFFFADIVQAATDMGSLVVAAAGNNANDVPFFPASYDVVLSVGAELGDLSGRRANFSSYGYFVDVFAVGQSVLGTSFIFNENTGAYTDVYRRSSGTSFAAPIVSGLAALIRHAHPDWSPQRIAAQIRSTATSLDSQNPGLRSRMGTGSIHAHRAVTDIQPAIILESFEVVNRNSRKANMGEDATLRLNLRNVGDPVTGLRFTFSSVQGEILYTMPIQDVAAIGEGDLRRVEVPLRISNETNPALAPVFRVDISNPQNYRNFLIMPYFDYDYDLVEAADFTLSVGSDGTFAYRATENYFGGAGMRDQFGQSLIYEASFMLAARPGNFFYVLDNTRSTNMRNRDFESQRWFRFAPETKRGFTQFVAENELKILGIVVRKEVISGEVAGIPNTLFFRYLITNHSNQDISAMYPGVFINWQIPSYLTNVVHFSPGDSLQIVHGGSENAPYVSLAHLGNVASAFAINNTSQMTLQAAQNRTDSLSFGIYFDNSQTGFNGFTDGEKRIALRAGLEKTALDSTDVSTVSSSGPFVFPKGAQVSTGFVLSYAMSKETLQTQVAEARSVNLFPVSPPGFPEGIQEPVELPEKLVLFPAFPNPFNPGTEITYYLDGVYHVQIEVFDMLGRRVQTLVQEQQAEGFYRTRFQAAGLASGHYLIVLRAGQEIATQRVTLIR